VISDGKFVGTYHKIYLHYYGVFDKNRYFRPGNECPVYIINGVGIGITICEDIWYEAGPATVQANAGAEVIVNISASPYYAGKGMLHEKMVATGLRILGRYSRTIMPLVGRMNLSLMVIA
jgi:NAD+ synthase (glutamine-hydrolysing)